MPNPTKTRTTKLPFVAIPLQGTFRFHTRNLLRNDRDCDWYVKSFNAGAFLVEITDEDNPELPVPTHQVRTRAARSAGQAFGFDQMMEVRIELDPDSDLEVAYLAERFVCGADNEFCLVIFHYQLQALDFGDVATTRMKTRDWHTVLVDKPERVTHHERLSR